MTREKILGSDAMARKRNKRKNGGKANWGELILFVMVIAIIYFVLSLFGSSLTGEGGKVWGDYLRGTWGGGVIILLLFWLYVCVAGFVKVRIPKFPRQLLGTLQLYISVAFLLGYLRHSGWEYDAVLVTPGSIGYGIARFFVLNAGNFITLILIIMSFLFSAYLFGSKLLNVKLPDMQFENLSSRFTRKRKAKPDYDEDLEPKPKRKSERDDRDKNYDDNIFRMNNLPEPKFEQREDTLISILSSVSKSRRESGENNIDYEEMDPESEASRAAIEKIDKLLDSFNAGYFAPPEKRDNRQRRDFAIRHKRNRRPFPEVLDKSNSANDASHETDNTVELDYDEEYKDSVFPPPIDIFGADLKQEIRDDSKIYERQSRMLVQALRNYDVVATVKKIVPGFQIVSFELALSAGTKLSKITNLSDELAMSLGVTSVRLEAPILGTKFVGVEIPVIERRILSLRSVLSSKVFRRAQTRLPIPLGVNINSEICVRGLEDLTHLLITGGNRTGKSMFVNCCIMSLCSRCKPDDLRIILTNTKHVEFSIYDNLPHLLFKPISEAEHALKMLSWVLKETELRTEKFAAVKARNIEAYNSNRNVTEHLPNLVVIIDELSDLMLTKSRETENLLVRIAQKSRALGVFLIISTDKFSPDVITGLIKANIPTKITFALPSLNDSRTVLDYPGAEKLTGKGDMLLKTTDTPRLFRMQTPFVSEDNIPDFVEYMHNIFMNYRAVDFI